MPLHTWGLWHPRRLQHCWVILLHVYGLFPILLTSATILQLFVLKTHNFKFVSSHLLDYFLSFLWKNEIHQARISLNLSSFPGTHMCTSTLACLLPASLKKMHPSFQMHPHTWHGILSSSFFLGIWFNFTYPLSIDIFPQYVNTYIKTYPVIMGIL